VSVDPDAVDRLTRLIVSLTHDCETALVRALAAALAPGVASEDLIDERWAQAKLAELARHRRFWQEIVDDYLRRVGPHLSQAISDGDKHGRELAIRQLIKALGETRGPLGASRAMLALAMELSGVVESTRAGILRSVEDTYRGVVADVVGRAITGSRTRRQVAQSALDRLTRAGIAGFVDRAGRRWELASYVEMATRTATQRAMTQGHSETLLSRGVDLVMVSDAPQECSRCRPWEGKVLSLSSHGGSVTLPSVVDRERLVSVDVTASLDRAKAAGLYHPNCRHSHSAYLPGLTKRLTKTEDLKGDADRQELRRLERELRRAKMEKAAALDAEAKRAANAKVQERKAAVAKHVESSGMIRQPAREKIGVAR
jgi:hypothetical protein